MRAGVAGLLKGGPTGPATEIVLPDALSSYNATVTPTNSNAGAIAAIIDGSDSSFVYGSGSSSPPQLTALGFAALAQDFGRPVVSFTVTVRANRGVAANINVGTFGTLTVTPTSASTAIATSPTTYVLGPFTRNAGVAWTAANFNAMTMTINVTAGGSAAGIYEVFLTASY